MYITHGFWCSYSSCRIHSMFVVKAINLMSHLWRRDWIHSVFVCCPWRAVNDDSFNADLLLLLQLCCYIFRCPFISNSVWISFFTVFTIGLYFTCSLAANLITVFVTFICKIFYNCIFFVRETRFILFNCYFCSWAILMQRWNFQI